MEKTDYTKLVEDLFIPRWAEKLLERARRHNERFPVTRQIRMCWMKRLGLSSQWVQIKENGEVVAGERLLARVIPES